MWMGEPWEDWLIEWLNLFLLTCLTMPARRPKQPVSDYTSIAVRVDAYEVEVEASLNYSLKLADPRFTREDELVFTHVTSLELNGVALFPSGWSGDHFRITLRGGDLSQWLELTLKDVQKRDERGSPVFRKRRGELVPEYEPPHGIALLEKERGERAWSAWISLRHALVSDALTMLQHRQPLYIMIRARKIDRRR